MKLSKKSLLVVSFMLFSLFFGAGNLIFPPFLGQNAGSNMVPAILGFLTTAVILPVLGVVVVAKFDGLDKLSGKVCGWFGLVFTLLIYLSIGPGLGIPRAASVPFEMVVAPYLPSSANKTLWMVVYSLIFFLVVLWLCMTPQKLVKRIGYILTPSLLILLVFLFVSFLFLGKVDISKPTIDYAKLPFLKGFTEGYQTMDTIAALNFGLVISSALIGFGVKDMNGRIKYTIIAGIIAGVILASVYLMLSYMGMASSGVYDIQENGAWTLRCIVYQIFGFPGVILLASIFTLACMTTCVGLINSISSSFAYLFKKTNYKMWVIIITCFSFLVCNLGLNAILKISIPILNIIYPVAIVLIILGLTNKLWKNNKFTYKLVIFSTGVISILHSFDMVGVSLGFFTKVLRLLPFYEDGFGFLTVAIFMSLLSVLINLIYKKKVARDEQGRFNTGGE